MLLTRAARRAADVYDAYDDTLMPRHMPPPLRYTPPADCRHTLMIRCLHYF